MEAKTVHLQIVNLQIIIRCNQYITLMSDYFVTNIMKLLYYIFSVFLSFILGGCENYGNKNSHFTNEQIASLHLDSTFILTTDIDSIKKINLNSFLKRKDFLFDFFIDEIKIVPLETTNESLIADIKKILITEKYIYIVDYYKGGSVLIFDVTGKFVTRILQGEAPQEIYNPNDITFDEIQQNLIIYNKYYLSYYTNDGRFVKRIRVPFRADEVTSTPEGYLFKAYNGQGNKHLGFSSEYLFMVTDKSFKLKSIGLPYLFSNETGYGNLIGFLHEGKHKIIVTTEYADTIYEYSSVENKLKAKYALDISEKEIPKKRLGRTWGDLKNTLQQNNYFLYNGAFLETNSHELFYVENWYMRCNLMVFRDKQSGNMKGGTRMLYNTENMPPINSPIASFNKYFVSCYLPQNKWKPSKNFQISAEDRVGIENLKEDDNPALVFFSLKKIDNNE